MKKKLKDPTILTLILTILFFIIGIFQLHVSIKVGNYPMPTVKLECILILGLIIYFIVHHLIIRKTIIYELNRKHNIQISEIKTEYEQKIQVEKKDHQDHVWDIEAECKEKFENELDKEVEKRVGKILIIKEFSAIVTNLKPFFDQNITHSFVKILTLDSQKNEKDKLIFLNGNFKEFIERFNDSYIGELGTRYKELKRIINEVEPMFHLFEPRQRRASGFKAGKYAQLRMDYNATISKFNFFMQAYHERLSVEWTQQFKPLPD